MISLLAFLSLVIKSETLVPGDLIIVADGRQLGAQVPIPIESDGKANVPVLGRVSLGGLTVLAAERKVRALANQHQVDPDFISLFRARRAGRYGLMN